MRKGALAAVALLAAGGIAVWMGRPRRPPAPPPSPAPSVLDLEDLVRRVEEEFGREPLLAPDFEGTALFREPPGEARVVAGVEIRSAGPDPRLLGPSAFLSSLAIDADRLDLELPSARIEKGALVATLKADALRARDGRAKRWTAEGAAEFVELDGRPRLRRFRGTAARTEEGPIRFVERTLVENVEAGGLAAGDVDGDGAADLFGGGRLWRNEGGRFVDAGVEAPGGGALLLDVDNDGDLDLLAGGALHLNEGGGFAREAGPSGTAFCAADVDGDGDLDVFACGESGRLWIRGGGERALAGPCRAAAFADADGDGDADLAVVGEDGGKRLFRNRGGGAFEDATGPAGAGDPGLGRGVLWLDYDEDGDPDLYWSNETSGRRALARSGLGLAPKFMDPLARAARGSALLRNDGKGVFKDVTSATGGGRAGAAWGATGFDYDNDGRLDLLVASGSGSPLFHRTDRGFEDVGATMGAARLPAGEFVTLDVDQDGALDVVFHDAERGALVALLNRAAPPEQRWIRLRARGAPGVRAVVNRRPREVPAGGELHVGLGPAETADVELRWPSGQADRYEDLETGRLWILWEGEPERAEAVELRRE